MTRHFCLGIVVLGAISVPIAGALPAAARPSQAAAATAEAMAAAKSNPDGDSKVGSLLAGALK
jgi:hypothetical protein